MSRSRYVTYQGVVYSLKDLARSFGISSEALSRRIKRWPESKWDRPISERYVKQSVRVTYMGKEYPSIGKLARELHMNERLLSDRIRHGWPESDWTLPSGQRIRETHYIKVKYMGKEYDSIVSLARVLNMDTDVLHHRIKRGWPEEKWTLPYKGSVPLPFIVIGDKIFTRVLSPTHEQMTIQGHVFSKYNVERSGLSRAAIDSRIRRGRSISSVLKTKQRKVNESDQIRRELSVLGCII